MLVRIVPVLTLTFVVVGLGCTKPAEVPATPQPREGAPAPVAQVRIDDHRIIDLDAGADSGVTSPPAVGAPVAQTILEKEALPKESDDATDYFAAGARFLEEGRPMEAVGAFRIALSSDTSAEVWQKLGEAYLAAGDEDRGVPCLEEAVAREPGVGVARRALVKHYLAKADGERARVHAEELVRQRPLDAGARQMLGRAYMQEKMWKEAIASFALVVKDEPDNIFAHNNIGYSALQIGALDLARNHLERCLSLEPQQGYMLNNLGVTYERLGRSAEAHAAFSRAAELSPRYVQAKLNRDRLQGGLSQDDRIVSAETLLKMREPEVVDGAVPRIETDDGEGDEVRDAVDAAVDASTGPTGGSARLAPAP